MKRSTGSLRLCRETLLAMETKDLNEVRGAGISPPMSLTTHGCLTGAICNTCLGCK